MAEKSNVTRISAKDDAPKKEKTSSKAGSKAVKGPKALKSTRATKKAQQSSDEARGSLATYFKGAWHELKQVRWPNRKATWSLTAAVLLFSAFFVAFILLLDLLFGYLFELIIV